MKTLLSLLLSFISFSAFSQVIIFNQGFENPRVNPNQNWIYSGGQKTSDTYKEGSFSLGIGRQGNSNEVTFNTVNISTYNDVTLQISHSVLPGESGLDDLEGIAFQVSLNGNSWATINKVSGTSNLHYTFNDTVSGYNPTLGSCRMFKTPNPLNYRVPQGTSSIAVRVISVKSNNCRGFNNDANLGIATNYDRTDEGFYIDNVRLISNEQSSTFPVKLVKFESQVINKNVHLDWLTATEINTDKFVIERSNDGINFQEIGSITANNYEDVESYYNFIDEMPSTGDNYYRLKIEDLDETTEYSKIIYNFLEKDFDIKIFPNPISAGDNLNIEIESNIQNMFITDLNGRVVSTNNQVPISASPGIYIVILQIENTLITNKIQVK